MHNGGLTLSLFKQHSLRKQDVELMSQLLALNSSIQEFKSHSNSSSMSNFSDISDAETDVAENESNLPARHGWYQPESSDSDSSSDLETRGRQFRPNARFYNRAGCGTNRDGLNTEVICYYSNASSRHSTSAGSNPSLTGYDISPQSVSPVSSEPPFQHAQYSRQRAWLNQEFLVSNGRTGSDPTINREFPEDGGVLHPPVQSRAFFPADEKVRELIDQKRLYSRRNTTTATQSPIGNPSHSGSDRSLNSDRNGPMSSQPISSRLQKWQRSRSSCMLNSGCRTPSPVLNTIKVDLRQNSPMAGTAIELILPISPLQPTRRSSAVRMAERRPLSKLNTLNKRQSMIW